MTKEGIKMEIKSKQQGQVVLITLLVMAVILTIGMSIISRTIVDVKTSQQTQESARAFWLAQGELEKAIRANSSGVISGENPDGDMTYQVTRSELGGGKEYVFPEIVKADSPATVWLVGHNSDGTIDNNFLDLTDLSLYWGESTTSKPAVEVTLLYQQSGATKIARYVYDSGDTATSNFSQAVSGSTVAGKAYAYGSGPIDVTPLRDGGVTKIYFAKVRLINTTNGEPLAVKISSGNSLPGQGSCYESVSVVSKSNITRRLTSCLMWPELPTVFDSVLYSGGSI